MTYMTIPATISGGPSIFQVRIGSGEVLSAGDEADFLVAFYQHSYQDHLGFLREGGVLLYDSDNVEPNLDDKRFVYVGVPITGLTVEALGGTAKDKGKNIFVLGLISKIFNLDVEKLKRIITEKFGGKDESVVNTALMAFQAGYAYPVGNVLTKHYRFEHIPRASGRAQITMDGNQAIAYGLIAGGVRFGAGYPITPWSSVMETLRRELPKYGGIFVQAEDELASVSIALGCSYSGYLAVTGSAGPGISLKAEAIGWASMAEIPLVICNIQRGGRAQVCQRTLSKVIYIRRSSAVTATARASCSRRRVWKIVSILRSKPHGSRKIQHAGFHSERHIARDAHRSVRRTRSFEVNGRSQARPYAAADTQTVSDRSNHTARGTRHAHPRWKISAARRTRARRNGSSNRQSEATHGNDGEASQQIAQAR